MRETEVLTMITVKFPQFLETFFVLL